MLPTGDYFGSSAVELAGIVAGKRGAGTELVADFITRNAPTEMIAYTRNPKLLRVLAKTCRVLDVLSHDYPEYIVDKIPHATLANDGHMYHINRYAPHGLYGGHDPADDEYNDRVLKERCVLLQNENTALAVYAEVPGGQ